MSEILTPPPEIEREAQKYGQAMLRFVNSTDFPIDILTYPDHLMIKTTSPSDFDKKVKAINPWSEQVAFMEIDERFLVAAHLVVPLTMTQYRPVEWLEIMEPKSPESTSDYPGAEYVEFYHNNFNEAGLLMKKRRITYEKRVDGHHRWWNIRINDEGQELRITDKPLSEIIGQELDDGTARQLYNIAA